MSFYAPSCSLWQPYIKHVVFGTYLKIYVTMSFYCLSGLFVYKMWHGKPGNNGRPSVHVLTNCTDTQSLRTSLRGKVIGTVFAQFSHRIHKNFTCICENDSYQTDHFICIHSFASCRTLVTIIYAKMRIMLNRFFLVTKAKN